MVKRKRLIIYSLLVRISSSWLTTTLPQSKFHHSNVETTFLTSSMHRLGQDNLQAINGMNDEDDAKNLTDDGVGKSSYDLGIGKNKPFDNVQEDSDSEEKAQSDDPTARMPLEAAEFWRAPEPVAKRIRIARPVGAPAPISDSEKIILKPRRTRRMVAVDNHSATLRAALWDEQHFHKKISDGSLSHNGYSTNGNNIISRSPTSSNVITGFNMGSNSAFKPAAFYPDIDLSIPESVYSDDGSVDLVWDLLYWEAYQNQQSQNEPLLVSFMHSTILNHRTLESSLSFLLANRLQSPAIMISTQLQSLILEALENDAVFRRKLRADIMAVRDRDPACNALPDVFLYFKGFHALQSHRVANCLWRSGRHVLAQFLQSQVSQIFQIDIHPNATLGSGIMLDHGTGIVIGETATVGHNCSILHHVTLGGSGKKGVVRHPSIGNGVLLGAGATVLGPVSIGEGTQIGASSLVISDLPSHCVAVGVPARIIGSFVDITEQPSIGMNQLMDDSSSIITFESDGI